MLFKTSQNIPLTLDRQIDITYALKLSYFRKSDLWKMEVLWIFSLWDKEIDTWFTNHKTLIPTLIAIWCNHSWSMNFLKSTWIWDFFFFKFHSDYKVYNVSSNRKISGLLEHLIFFFQRWCMSYFQESRHYLLSRQIRRQRNTGTDSSMYQ